MGAFQQLVGGGVCGDAQGEQVLGVDGERGHHRQAQGDGQHDGGQVVHGQREGLRGG